MLWFTLGECVSECVVMCFTGMVGMFTLFGIDSFVVIVGVCLWVAFLLSIFY